MLRSLVAVRASRPAFSSHADPWSQLSLKELKAECKNRGLKVSGKKVELVRRLTNLNNTGDNQSKLRIHIDRPKLSRNKSKKSELITSSEQVRSINSKTKSDRITVLKSDSNEVIPKESDSIPTINGSNVRTSSVNHVQNPPIERVQSPSIEHMQELPINHGTEKSQFTKTKDSVKTTRPNANGTPIDQNIYPSDSLSLRDKFFFFTSTTCITIWWWWPYTPSFIDQILKSCKYLQSFF
ncbi:hypothetical protein ZYGR_0AI03080 [Zygosaccharomyces rouxii]|uniref:SAP domain-containing protein n=1 Tax=Zygosaccharomyces rouxii TaxID=4956 RepID=A0A1Q3AB87_ZYGRO|nr:hypothetical protein ZYGR_0AI03080 [Zygosaccharomyces rouxii]